MIDLSITAIDAGDPALQGLLGNLQGNILKPHGRDHVELLLVDFGTAAPGKVRAWIRWLAGAHVTSAARQRAERNRHRDGHPTGLFGSFLWTATGAAALGLSSTALPEAAAVGGSGACTSGPGVAASFAAGMKAAAGELGDRLDSWDAPYRQDLHAMVLLAGDRAEAVAAAAREVAAGLPAGARVAQREVGGVTRDALGRSIEPFGHVDGISQPLFYGDDLAAAGESRNWDPSASLDLVLVKDTFTSAPDCYGSFVVFRKLEQDLAAYRRQLEELQAKVGISAALADAMVVGRFADGTPLDLPPVAAGPVAPAAAAGRGPGLPPPAPPANDFAYANDANGTRCPLHAHIRKANQRGSAPADAAAAQAARGHRIVRRGIPYGPPPPMPAPVPAPAGGAAGGVTAAQAEPVGILFLCYQSSIANQFAFIQKQWANAPCFPFPGTGFDPIVGQTGAGPVNYQQLWSKTYGARPDQSFPFGNVVTVRGGEFFFAPSLATLLTLAP
jgi:Dyp-type peroxidase family